MVADEAAEWASLFSARVDLKMALDRVDWNDAFRACEAHGDGQAMVGMFVKTLGNKI